MSWSFDWSVIGDALTSVIHRIGEVIDIIVQTIQISFP